MAALSLSQMSHSSTAVMGYDFSHAMPVQRQKALGMGPFQPEFGHFHPFDLLNIVVHTGNGSGKQFISAKHAIHSLSNC